MRDAAQRHLLISDASYRFHPWDMPCSCVQGAHVGGEVERMLYLHTSHHVLFISHLDVFIYPMPQRKSALIKRESTQDFKVTQQSVQLSSERLNKELKDWFLK